MTVAIDIQRQGQLERSIGSKSFWWLGAWFYRFWWHTKAYATVLGVSVLVLLSLVVLFGQRFVETRSAPKVDRNAEEQDGDLISLPSRYN